jgi:hypothetical protein
VACKTGIFSKPKSQNRTKPAANPKSEA